MAMARSHFGFGVLYTRGSRMNRTDRLRPSSVRLGALLATLAFVSAPAFAGHQNARDVLIVTSSNNSTNNSVLVFKLETGQKPALVLTETLPTGGKGGASTNAGIVQFQDHFGAVANYGTNTVTRLVRVGDYIGMDGILPLAAGCQKPDSVALSAGHLFVVGTNCAETLRWPQGGQASQPIALSDPSAAQIAVGDSWAAVTLSSGSVLQMPLRADGALAGSAATITLPAEANNTPLGAAFWDDNLGFTPAHSPDSFAIVNPKREVFPVVGPTPPFPTNAPCWVAKGPGNIWYTGNSPSQAISVFFSDDEGGAFYKSVPVPGTATDLAVSPDGRWLAALYTAGGNGYVAVFAIDVYGSLTQVATSAAVGVAAFSGVAISQ
jgi:hypothetical protein